MIDDNLEGPRAPRAIGSFADWQAAVKATYLMPVSVAFATLNPRLLVSLSIPVPVPPGVPIPPPMLPLVPVPNPVFVGVCWSSMRFPPQRRWSRESARLSLAS